MSWSDLVSLLSIQRPEAYLKGMSHLLGVEVKTIVEIGVYRGNISKMLRILFPDAFLYLIDPWELYEEYQSEEAGPISLQADDYEVAYQEVQHFFSNDPKVKILRMSSLKALLEVPNELDMVFIDGNHSYKYVLQDIQNWFPKVRKGGIIAGHDYDPHLFPQVIQAVDVCFPEVMLGPDYTWLKQK